MCGAGYTLATDLDRAAVKVAGENVARNGQDITVRYGDLLEAVEPGEVFDTAIANIIAEVIIPLSGQIGSVLKPGGKFIASGIIRAREQDVLDALAQNGFTVLEIRRRGEWVAIASRRDG